MTIQFFECMKTGGHRFKTVKPHPEEGNIVACQKCELKAQETSASLTVLVDQYL
jgi:transcription elongation factor Elf1